MTQHLLSPFACLSDFLYMRFGQEGFSMPSQSTALSKFSDHMRMACKEMTLPSNLAGLSTDFSLSRILWTIPYQQYHIGQTVE